MKVYYLVFGSKLHALPNYLTNSLEFLQQGSTDPSATFQSDACRRIYIPHCTSKQKSIVSEKQYQIDIILSHLFVGNWLVRTRRLKHNHFDSLIQQGPMS